MTEFLPKKYFNVVRKRCDKPIKSPWIASVEGRDHALGGDSVCTPISKVFPTIHPFPSDA
jgi:hypothetical protein